MWHDYVVDGNDSGSDLEEDDETGEELWHPEVWLDAHSEVIVPLWERLRDDAFLTGLFRRPLWDFCEACYNWTTSPAKDDDDAATKGGDDFVDRMATSLWCIFSETRSSCKLPSLSCDKRFLQYATPESFKRFCLS